MKSRMNHQTTLRYRIRRKQNNHWVSVRWAVEDEEEAIQALERIRENNPAERYEIFVVHTTEVMATSTPDPELNA